MARKKLITSDEATAATGQHTSPCGDCPWRKDAIPGWLGGVTPEVFLGRATGHCQMDCHMLVGAQCAGAAIFRRNICKMLIDKRLLVLPADRETVFPHPQAFLDHHRQAER